MPNEELHLSVLRALERDPTLSQRKREEHDRLLEEIETLRSEAESVAVPRN